MSTKTTAAAIPPVAASQAPPPAFEIVIPVYNEERALRDNVTTLLGRLREQFDLPFVVTIADNGSSDGTAAIARLLAGELEGVRHLRLDQRGRGRALRAAWGASDADVVAYMDVDLSTDLAHLPALLDPLLAGRADIVVGSRLAPGAQVTRGRKRDLISRLYNALLAMSLRVGFSDAQCGFKAARREVADALLPLVEDESWFFDTELLYLAQRNAFAIREVPVRWVDDTDSRVQIVRTAIEDLKGIRRLRRRTREGSDRLATPAGARPSRSLRQVGARRAGTHRLGAAH
jgi:glycosyltransferase involved in cell wall biosynthesis